MKKTFAALVMSGIVLIPAGAALAQSDAAPTDQTCTNTQPVRARDRAASKTQQAQRDRTQDRTHDGTCDATCDGAQTRSQASDRQAQRNGSAPAASARRHGVS